MLAAYSILLKSLALLSRSFIMLCKIEGKQISLKCKKEQIQDIACIVSSAFLAISDPPCRIFAFPEGTENFHVSCFASSG